MILRNTSVGILTHILDNDSRNIVTPDGTILLTFDSSLGVHRGGQKIGRLSSAASTWAYEANDGTTYDTGVLVRDYHWLNLEEAEAKVAEKLLGPKHTQGRIRATAEGRHAVSVEDGRIFAAPEHMKTWRWPENLRRLVACWNLLLPFTTEKIEAGTADVLLLAAQRDVLLAALQKIAGYELPDEAAIVAAARDAIAKVTTTTS